MHACELTTRWCSTTAVNARLPIDAAHLYWQRAIVRVNDSKSAGVGIARCFEWRAAGAQLHHGRNFDLAPRAGRHRRYTDMMASRLTTSCNTTQPHSDTLVKLALFGCGLHPLLAHLILACPHRGVLTDGRLLHPGQAQQTPSTCVNHHSVPAAAVF